MSRPFIRTAVLLDEERRSIRKVMVTVKNAYDVLKPALTGVTWNQFRLALCGKAAEPEVLVKIRTAFTTWKLRDRGGVAISPPEVP